MNAWKNMPPGAMSQTRDMAANDNRSAAQRMQMEKFIAYVKDGNVTIRVGFMGNNRNKVAQVARDLYPDEAFRLRKVTAKEWAKVKMKSRLMLIDDYVQRLESDF